MTVSEYIKYWYETYRLPNQVETTRETTLSLIRCHINNTPLGALELHEVTSHDVQVHLTMERMQGNKTELRNYSQKGKPLSAYTVSKLRTLLIACFERACKEGLLTENVASYTEPVKNKWHDAPVFSAEAQRKFLQATRGHRFYVAYVLAFYLGMRRSEILGLSWDSVDLRRNMLVIRQVLVMEKGMPVLRQRTKTHASMRTIPFPMEIRELLREVKRRQAEEKHTIECYYNENHLVFSNPDGSPHSPVYFSRNFKAMCKKIEGVDSSLHLHSARHTFATNMVRLGIGIADIQAIGGWSRPDVLLRIYAHSVKESQRKAVKKLFKEV